MRRGTSRTMPRKSTGLTDRLTLPIKPELLREIDQVRGDVPRWHGFGASLRSLLRVIVRGRTRGQRNDSPVRCVALPPRV